MKKELLDILDALESKKIKIKVLNDISNDRVILIANYKGSYKKLLSICNEVTLSNENIHVFYIKNTLTGTLECSMKITC